MKLNIHSIHFDADKKLIDFINAKVAKLEKIFDKIIDGEVFLRLENTGIENKIVEIKLNIPGEQLFTKESAKLFEVATENATESLRRQLKKHKQKLISR